jgi:hypothetical protein
MVGLTGAQAVAEVQQGLNFRSDRSTEILQALNNVQGLREMGGQTLPWFLVAQDQALTTSTTTQEVALPTGFIQEVEEAEAGLRYQASATSRTFFLKKMGYEAAEKYFFGDWQNNWDLDSTSTADALSPGTPRAYVLRKSTIRIYPASDQAYSLLWDFYKNDDPVTNSSTQNQWLTYAPWVLIGGAGWKMASDMKNADAMSSFATIAKQAESALIGAINRRKLAGRPLRMGSRL